MSLSPGEQRVLRGIDEATRRSDPGLASLLAIFARLTAGEATPERERLRRPASRARAALLLVTTALARLTACAARLTTNRDRSQCSRPRSAPIRPPAASRSRQRRPGHGPRAGQPAAPGHSRPRSN